MLGSRHGREQSPLDEDRAISGYCRGCLYSPTLNGSLHGSFSGLSQCPNGLVADRRVTDRRWALVADPMIIFGGIR